MLLICLLPDPHLSLKSFFGLEMEPIFSVGTSVDFQSIPKLNILVQEKVF
jgi:hypothetical protein